MHYYCEHCDSIFEIPAQKMKTTETWTEERGMHSVNYFEDCCPKCHSTHIWEEEDEEDEDNQ